MEIILTGGASLHLLFVRKSVNKIKNISHITPPKRLADLSLNIQEIFHGVL